MVHRQWVATFTKSELEVLRDYGDLLAVDPTFSPMTSDWSIIPLTAVDKERRIRSAGIIFASSGKGTVFKWILELLLLQLPCRNTLKTLISDDDVGLDSAFHIIQEQESRTPEEVLLRERASSIKRIICFWHKCSNFSKFVSALKLTQEEKHKCMELFRAIGMSRDRTLVDQYIEQLSGIHNEIKTYLEKNIVHKLGLMSKAYIGDTFTAGYNTSSIAESTNSRLKSFVQNKALTLLEMREAATELQTQSESNKNYIKCRKPHKTQDCQVLQIMVDLNVSASIASAIAGSKQKAGRLKLSRRGPFFYIQDNITDLDGTVLRSESFKVKGRICSCMKMQQTGIPCSHILAVLAEQGLTITRELINKRWILDAEELSVTDIELKSIQNSTKLPPSKNGTVITSTTGRYVTLLSQGSSLASIASRKRSWFERVYRALDTLEQEILSEDVTSQVTDEHGSRPGRKPKRRK